MGRNIIWLALGMFLIACGGSKASVQDGASSSGAETTEDGAAANVSGQDDFGLKQGDAKSAQGVTQSKLKSTKTEAVLKLIVRNDKDEPVSRIVVKAETDDGQKFYTPETDATGYTEILAPVGKQYTLTYLSLFEDTVKKQAVIPNEPNITMKLTLIYTPLKPKPIPLGPDEGKLIEEKEYEEPTLRLEGVVFDTGKATLKPESFPHLEGVIEFMTYKPSAIIELSGHTDSVGNDKKNKKLSQARADAVRDYIVSKGVEADRIIAVGYGEEKPIASNDTEKGRQLNRRTEAKEIK